MKIIEYVATAQTETYLPPEVLEVIVQFVQLRSQSPRMMQRDLWSYCLVCRDWYTITIKHLYRQPNLTSRNFAEFARTISPPVASRTRRIGLEDFVMHIDMSGLAYESRKSTTSRLISRTKNSLVSFLGPAVSLSTTSLAPLSKCSKLQRLDLSRDNYDFSVASLMRSIRTLPELQWLSLPKERTPLQMFFDMFDTPAPFWPSNLSYLQLNSPFEKPLSGLFWDCFNKSLPESLTSLTFANLASYNFFDWIEGIKVQALQLKVLLIRMGGVDSSYGLDQVSLAFPNLVRLTVPAITWWNVPGFAYTFDGRLIPASMNLSRRYPEFQQPPLQFLEEIILQDTPDLPFSDHIHAVDLQKFIGLPSLLRLSVPESYLNAENADEFDTCVDQNNRELARRAKEAKGGALGIAASSAGIYTTEPSTNSGVGLKRSVRVTA